MKKKLFYFVFATTAFYAQEKSKIIQTSETVVIKSNKNLEIESFVSESRQIAKSKNIQDYTARVYFDTFNEISNIKGSSYNPKTDKTNKLSGASVETIDAEQENIFKSDSKYKYFVIPGVEDGSRIDYSYKNKIKEPRFLSSFRFQSTLKTGSSKLQIKCDPTIEIGYKLFGNYQNKIVFTKSKADDMDVYTWEATDIPEFESESGMPHAIYFLPHLIYYIKSYEKDHKKETLLGTPEMLYKWYYSLVKDINKTDQNSLKNKTLELIKGKKNDLEKAKVIYQWVQQNMHYVAFENGMGGFVPREAAAVYEKLYGDCKDMANILNQMLHYANLNSSLAWIGTRHKPYTYQEVPTPQVDNHMIAQVVLDGKSYFLDATDKFCPFLFPSAMIQGKEALIGKSETEFKIEKVPEVASKNNKTVLQMKLTLANNNLTGTAHAQLFGFAKSELLHDLSTLNQKEKEVWKNAIVANNDKIQLEIKEVQKNDYQDLPAKADFGLALENAIKEVSGKLLLKPILLFPLKESAIDTEKRKLSIENDFAYVQEIAYEYDLPLDYKIEFLPANAKQENELAAFDIQYKVEKNKIVVSQKIESKKLLLEPKDFALWNAFIKNLNKQYNQSLILTK